MHKNVQRRSFSSMPSFYVGSVYTSWVPSKVLKPPQHSGGTTLSTIRSKQSGCFTNVSDRLPHDVGGDMASYGPILRENTGALLAWEQECHSLFSILASKGLIATDELRRSIEALTPRQYDTWSYYEKWTAAMVSLLLEKGLLQVDELYNSLFGESLPLLDAEEAPKFKAGDAVRVRNNLLSSDVEWRRPHLRTPGYIYGVSGEVERVCGRHGDPSYLAFGLEAPEVQLYRVRFRQRDLWPEQSANASDVVEVEVYEHWLEPSLSASGHSYEETELSDHSTLASGVHEHIHTSESGPEEHLGHVHEARKDIELNAVDKEGGHRPGQSLFFALCTVLIDKDIIAPDELRQMTERLETAGTRLDGATLVVNAWLSPSFEEHLLRDAATAASEIGISTSNPNAPTVLTVVKNTAEIHNIVVCTLCSCYPSGMMGIAPSWYKSREYRSRAVREPRILLKEGFGLEVPLSKQIRVHDSTADHRYLVLPERPDGTDGWSKEELQQVVKRDTMIGVAICDTTRNA